MFDKPYSSLLSTGWSVEEVNQQFLERAGLGYMGEQFYANKINGKCLMLLNEVSFQRLCLLIWPPPKSSTSTYTNI